MIMGDYDKKIKTEMQGYLKKNIHFSSEDRERIQSKIQKKKRVNFLYYGAFTMTVFIAILFIFPILQGDSSKLNITPPGFSEKQTEMKGMLDESWGNEEEENSDIEEKSVKDSTEQTEKNNEPVEQEQPENINEESVVQTKEPEKDEAEEKIEKEQEEEEEHTTEKMQLTKAVAWELVKKFNSITPTLVSLTDKEYLHPEVVGYELVGFETPDQVYELFTDFIEKAVTKKMHGHTITTYEDKVYLIPMDGPLSFNLNNDIHITTIDNEKYKISQDVEPPFNFYAEIVVAKINGNWKIVDYYSEGF